MVWQLHEFRDTSSLNQALARAVTVQLKTALLLDKAVLAVSGGSTPAAFFEVLSGADLPWEKVTVTVVDERCVSPDSEDSNARLVREHLLKNGAAAAHFLPLFEAGSNSQADKLAHQFKDRNLLPLDITILGMGTDGHTASLFPCAKNISDLMSTTDDQTIFHEVEPVTAPYRRITFSLPALLQSGMLILHIAGTKKREVLEQALAGTSITEMPIRAFLHHPDKVIDIYWAP